MNFRTLDLNLLRVFDSVMAEGSLTRAALVLAMTQPAVSHAIRRLHDTVGEPLFERSAHGMKPTPRALALWPPVRAALSGLQGALAPSDFTPQRDPATFRLAMADATAALMLPPLVVELERQRALGHRVQARRCGKEDQAVGAIDILDVEAVEPLQFVPRPDPRKPRGILDRTSAGIRGHQ